MIIVIQIIFRVLSFIVIVDALVSFFLPPFNSVRSFLDRIVAPMLAPIRKLVPAVGGMDFSPLILLILIQVLEYLIVRLL